MVTPEQKHSGEAVTILARREGVKARTLAARRAANAKNAGQNKIPEAAFS